MTSLTITVEDEVFEKAREWAVERGTSVEALLRERLEELAAEGGSYRAAVRSLIERSHRVNGRRGDRGWTREDLYDRGVLT